MKRFQCTAVLAAILATTFAGPASRVALAQKTSSGAARALPKDVFPDSLNRLPLVKPEDMKDEASKKIYNFYANPNARSLAGLQGPGGIRLYSPRLAQLSEPVNTYLRYETEIPRRLAELAILITAREMDSQFEWTAHEPTGLKEGLEQSIIDVVKYRKDTKGLGEKEAVIINVGRELFGKRNLSSATFAAARKAFGDRGIVDLISLMTNYVSTSYYLKAFDMQLHSDQKLLLPQP
jgi:4-carboxymuconolactone decarboxylase